MDKLPYSYELDDPEGLLERLTSKEDGAGAKQLDLTSKEWMTTSYK
ncbi:MAG: hypothetical protein K5986_09365 [Clostridium sp.]|nr:hypothetical protein [Clostridium sp.]